MSRRVEAYRGAQNLSTPHQADDYPGLLVVRPGPAWRNGIIVPQDGQTVLGLGGERILPYRTPTGGIAQGFELRPGDRATRVRSGLEFAFAEWRVERAPES